MLVDIVSPEEQDLAEEHNRLERLRDPSHTTALSIPHMRELLESRGLEVGETTPTLGVDMDVDNWLESTNTMEESRGEVRRVLGREVEGGAASGMGGYVDQAGRLCFTHTYAVMVAAKK